MPDITINSRVPFGKKPEKGRRLCECSSHFLNWVVNKMWDSDFHEWAFNAKKILESRKINGDTIESGDSLEDIADAILTNAGCGGLCKRNRGWR